MSQATTWGAPRAADAPVPPETYADRVDISFDALLSSHSGGTRPSYAVEGTTWYDTDTDSLFLYDGSADLQIGVNRGAPSGAADTGQVGWLAWDADYIYVCTATDTWKRVAVATW